MNNTPVTFQQHFNTLNKHDVQKSHDSKSAGFSRKLEIIFDEIGPKETKKVLFFWQMLLRSYGAKMRTTYGNEPDQEFVNIAVSLNRNQMERIADNIHDLLVEGKAFPPAYEELRMLSQRPTRFEINMAMQDLYFYPKPFTKLNRVDKYIKEYHYSKIKAFKLDKFEMLFEKVYINLWREVMIHNVDLRVKSQKDAVAESIAKTKENWSDLKVKDDLEQGRAFNNPFGQKILKIMADKKNTKRVLSCE